ncbi:MAG: hypothetical protein K8R53_00070 [Bacteroidales bacterium]|nr:hypothetical protein [Bacteroidales bacterium]
MSEENIGITDQNSGKPGIKRISAVQRIAFGAALVFFVFFVINEILQDLAEEGRLTYLPFMGYLSNLTLPASLTAIILGITRKIMVRFILLTLLVILIIYLEFFPYNGGPETFDWLDILFDITGLIISWLLVCFLIPYKANKRKPYRTNRV